MQCGCVFDAVCFPKVGVKFALTAVGVVLVCSLVLVKLELVFLTARLGCMHVSSCAVDAYYSQFHVDCMLLWNCLVSVLS